MDTEKKPKKLYRRWWFWFFAVLIVIVIGLALIPADKSTSPQQATPQEARTLGQDAYLRLPGNDDPNQQICLAPTLDLYSQYTTALMAKDYQGIIDLQGQGLFCVHNGAEVKVIDTGVGYTKVRVEQSVSADDSDEIGQAGWSASEWVVNQ